MLSTIVFWVLVTLIIFWILFPSIRSLWEIIVLWKIFNKETIDLRTKFGEWASKHEKKITSFEFKFQVIYKYNF